MESSSWGPDSELDKIGHIINIILVHNVTSSKITGTLSDAAQWNAKEIYVISWTAAAEHSSHTYILE